MSGSQPLPPLSHRPTRQRRPYRSRATTLTLDRMELEKQRGISITSTALTFEYKTNFINLLDTPGHQVGWGDVWLSGRLHVCAGLWGVNQADARMCVSLCMGMAITSRSHRQLICAGLQ